MTSVSHLIITLSVIIYLILIFCHLTIHGVLKLVIREGIVKMRLRVYYESDSSYVLIYTVTLELFKPKEDVIEVELGKQIEIQIVSVL